MAKSKLKPQAIKIVCQECEKEVGNDLAGHAAKHKDERQKDYANNQAEFYKKKIQSLKNRKAKAPDPVQRPSMSVKFIKYVGEEPEETIML